MTRHRSWRGLMAAAVIVLACGVWPDGARADETCNSPYISKLIKGQETSS